MNDQVNEAQTPLAEVSNPRDSAPEQYAYPALENNFQTSAGPWSCRAATFCDDGVPSFEVVMAQGKYMNACDARLIGAAPSLLQLLKVTLDHLEGRTVHISAATPLEDWATERAMMAAHVRDELDALLLPLQVNVPERETETTTVR